jgi:hypothetical protein
MLLSQIWFDYIASVPTAGRGWEGYLHDIMAIFISQTAVKHRSSCHQNKTLNIYWKEASSSSPGTFTTL